MTKPELVEALATKSGASRKDVEAVLGAFADVLKEKVLAGGDTVGLHGLGMFKQKQTKARTGRNPQTGASLEIPAKTSLGFKMSSSLK